MGGLNGRTEFSFGREIRCGLKDDRSEGSWKIGVWRGNAIHNSCSPAHEGLSQKKEKILIKLHSFKDDLQEGQGFLLYNT